MECEQEQVEGSSSEHAGALALYITSTSLVNGRVPQWMEMDPAGPQAPISVWWDYPPSYG